MASESRPSPVSAVPPKPITDIWRPELTRLPELTLGRRFFRRLVRAIARLLLALLTRTTFSGLERLPREPALLVINHLGDADAVLCLAAFSVGPEVLAKIEMLSFPMIGQWMDWYGMIWLHRGQPDRRALRAAQQAFEQGRSLVMAPEGRYTLVHGLEPGGRGAAYLAARARVPVIPVALTGSGNDAVYGSLRHLHRPRLTVTVGAPVDLIASGSSRQALDENTDRIMRALARLLPQEYRGAYR